MSVIKLVIADPSPSFISCASSYFSMTENIEVVATCSSGKEMLRLVRTLKPDAVLMDVILEELDGLSALKRLGSDMNGIAFIVCTEFSTECVISRAMKSGASAFVCKPADRAALLDTILETVAVSRHNDSLNADNFRKLDKIISDSLMSVGISGNSAGFLLIINAVRYMITNNTDTISMTKQLYPELARISGTTAACVERNIRSAITRAHSHGHLGMFGHKPTNREFITALAKYIASSTNIL